MQNLLVILTKGQIKHLHINKSQCQSSLGKTQHTVTKMWRMEGQYNGQRCEERNIGERRKGDKGIDYRNRRMEREVTSQWPNMRD